LWGVGVYYWRPDHGWITESDIAWFEMMFYPGAWTEQKWILMNFTIADLNNDLPPEGNYGMIEIFWIDKNEDTMNDICDRQFRIEECW